MMGLHVYGWLLRPEMMLTDLFSKDGSATKFVPDRWQYVIVFALAIGVAWMTLATSRRKHMGGIVAILLVELAGVAWICSLFKVFFQPLPAAGAVLLSYLAALGYIWFSAWFAEYLEERRSRPPKIAPAPDAARSANRGCAFGGCRS